MKQSGKKKKVLLLHTTSTNTANSHPFQPKEKKEDIGTKTNPTPEEKKQEKSLNIANKLSSFNIINELTMLFNLK